MYLHVLVMMAMIIMVIVMTIMMPSMMMTVMSSPPDKVGKSAPLVISQTIAFLTSHTLSTRTNLSEISIESLAMIFHKDHLLLHQGSAWQSLVLNKKLS